MNDPQSKGALSMRECDWPGSRAELWTRTEDVFRQTVQNPRRHQIPIDELAWYLCERVRLLRLFTAEDAIHRRVPQIASFVYACAPRRGSSLGLIEATEFLLCFFVLNDFWPAEQPFAPALRVRLSGVRQRFIKDHISRLERQYGSRAHRYLSAFSAYVRSLDHERQLRSRPASISLAEYRHRTRGRFQWVGTPPYIDLWTMTEGIELAPLDHTTRERLDRLRALSVEMTYIANDMGSFLRDGQDANLVNLLTDEADAPEAGLALAAEEYRSRAREYLAMARLLQKAPMPAHSYIDLVAGVTDGNRDMTALLTRLGDASRYASRASDLVARLPGLGFPMQHAQSEQQTEESRQRVAQWDF